MIVSNLDKPFYVLLALIIYGVPLTCIIESEIFDNKLYIVNTTGLSWDIQIPIHRTGVPKRNPQYINACFNRFNTMTRKKYLKQVFDNIRKNRRKHRHDRY
jgi:hypothetical protein